MEIIDDINKIEITKVNNYRIMFKYDGFIYLLTFGDNEDGDIIYLYKSDAKDDNSIHFEFVKNVKREYDIHELVDNAGTGGVSYSSISKENFCFKLDMLGLFITPYHTKVESICNKINELKIERSKCNKRTTDINSEINDIMHYKP